ncbi:hypothetical protein [Kitasatospora brasiliensis]|uniref:hypothetical protein n=1 Tax=Kitasatospora brasiliensis TaxID=3058040 RepID=UPI002931A184|nr:hypothetical protein [Kitasatospora sp. K002]
MPRSLRRLLPLTVAVAAVPVLALPAVPAGAVTYGTPTITFSAGYLSGAVGATGDPTVTVSVAQSGADASALTVAASATTRSAVARTGDVTVSGTGGSRTLAVAAQGVGYADLTIKVTGLGGKSATRTLHYAASPAVQYSATSRYLTGSSDASAAVDAGGGYLVVGDDESNTLRLYDRDNSGAPVRTWDFSSALGVSKEIDIEAATRVGNTIYWTGSLGNNKDGAIKPDRHTVFATTITGSGADTQLSLAGSYHGLRDDLITWDNAHGKRYGFAAGAADGQAPKQIDGFNVEGLEFAPGSTGTAYIGFRAPLTPAVTGGRALLVPVTNFSSLLNGSAAHATFGDPIELDLGGLSVRDIRRNDLGQYLIVAGSWAAEDNSAPYALYRWDGRPGSRPTKLIDLPTSDYGAWEAIADVPDLDAPGARVQLITDDGSADLYNDATAAKDLTHPEWKKSRSTWFTLN